MPRARSSKNNSTANLGREARPRPPESFYFSLLTLHFPPRHLAPHGMAGFVLANGSMSSNQSGEGTIRRALIEADLVDCMVALPGQLFYTAQIPVCLWFLAKDKTADANRGFRERRAQTLFIDTRKIGSVFDHNEDHGSESAALVSHNGLRGKTNADRKIPSQ